MAIDAQPVDSAAMISISGEKMDLNEIVERKFAGDKVTVTMIREGASKDVDITLKPLPWSRMYAIEYEKQPRYMVFAGLVFQPLDTNLLATAKFDDITVRRLYADYVPKGLFQKHSDIVVLTRVESDPVTSQLGDFAGFAVHKINGVEDTDLQQAYGLLHPKAPPEFHVIELSGASRPVIIPSAAVDDANARVAKNYGIARLENLTD
jgi:hypothetical protein